MAEAEEFSALPLPEQFAHKNWKARKGGYETATKEFKTAQPNDPLVRDFTYDSGLWKGAVGDSNVAAQQEALNAYNAFLEAAGPEGAKRTRSSTIAPIVEKGLTGRPAAKAASVEALLLLIELDKPDPVIEELLPFFSHKLPKIVVATLAALTEIYHAYGCKTVEPKPVLKLLPKVYGHADKNVRAEAQKLTVELYRWLREAMKPLFWGELKPVQQTDLDKLFEPVQSEPLPKQERLLRSQQAAKEEAAVQGDGEEYAEEVEEDAGIDLEPEFEVVDVFAKVPQDLNERLASTKWKDRKDVLDEVFAAVNIPAIQEGPFDDIIRGCAKSMKDANIAVVTVAANCIECIAKGLRKGFTKYRSSILAAMLERFKEKKASVTDAIGAACDAVFMATNLSEIETDVLEALKNKNPMVKENSAKFLVRSLKTTREAPSLEQTKELAEAGKKLLTEGAASLRDAGAETLGVLWKIMGDRNMLNHLDGLDDIRKNKIKEFSDAAEVKAKWKPKAAPAPAAPKASGPPGAKKPALGSKRPGAPGTKRPAAPKPPPQSPPPSDDAPLAPRPTSRPTPKPATSGLGGLRPPGAGLRAPGTGLAKPGTSLKPSTVPATSTASPKRQAMLLEDPPTPAQPKFGPGRGLAGRPLGKPAAASARPSSPSVEPSEAPPSRLTSLEREELLDLRAEMELLRTHNSDLRTEKLRLSSQITELQNQNAQLIEDHTRDVLQIKAKETQLVRARGDAESAEDRANGLSREIDRLKREMGRLTRSPPASNSHHNAAESHSPSEAYGNGDVSGGYTGGVQRPAYSSSRSYAASPAHHGYGGGEGKENVPDHLLRADGKLSGTGSTPLASSRTISNGSSGRETPGSGEEQSHRPTVGGAAPLNRSQSEGVESWRRAAEVTQNLKARIEMMKARQNLNRGPS